MRNRMKFLLLPALAIAMGLGSVSLPATASAQSAVRATVNDQPITSYDVGQRIKLMKLFRQPSGDKAVLNEMIDEVLLAQVATRRGMSVPDSMVEDPSRAAARSAAAHRSQRRSGQPKAGGP